MLKLYHAEPMANSLKSLIALKEKGLPFESVYVDLHKFEQHAPWFVAINPEGQVPVLDHDGAIITHTTVINEYLEDAFPEAPALRPADPIGKARMRFWNKFVDEHVMNYVSMHGWHRMVGIIARSIDAGEFEKLVARIPLYEQREKSKRRAQGSAPRTWRTLRARSKSPSRKSSSSSRALPIWPVSGSPSPTSTSLRCAAWVCSACSPR